jgi:pimeloyl-ACP methyl ester carboxylesterase
LDEVATPVFIIWGEADQILHPSSVEVFVRHLPDAEVYLFEDTGHSPMIERAGRAGGLYREFLERHPLTR